MKLSVPVYSLKRRAKELARINGMPLNRALDTVAIEEGFNNWSLLAAQLSSENPASALLSSLSPGDLVLVGARPGHGKTVLSLELVIRAIESGKKGYFFSLEWNLNDILKRLKIIGTEYKAIEGRFVFDNSDEIYAEYMIKRLHSVEPGSVVAVDYLQLLDQRRENPDLETQVAMLKAFAKERDLIIVLISQIDRSFELSDRKCPGLEDVRLVNPLDLSNFDKACFLNSGEIHISAVA